MLGPLLVGNPWENLSHHIEEMFSVATKTNELYQTNYLVWLYLSEGTEWNQNNLPNSSIKIKNIDISYTNYKKDLVDITNWYTGNTINQNVHVDHHFFYPLRFFLL